MSLNLHIGCGDNAKPGYVNIDEFNPRADRRIPIQAIDYPDNSVDRIEGYMVLEHLSLADARTFLRKANRMLSTGGILVLEVPDLEKVCRLILLFADDPEYLEKGAFGLRGLFGEPKPEMSAGDYHKWGYTSSSALRLLREAGFSHVEVKDGMSHCYPLRDMRIEAVK